jgi:hypothetical protein
MNVMSDAGLNLGIWDSKLIMKLDTIFAEIYFVSAGKKGRVLHPAFVTNTNDSYKMWTKYHKRIVEVIIKFESDTTFYGPHATPISLQWTTAYVYALQYLLLLQRSICIGYRL